MLQGCCFRKSKSQLPFCSVVLDCVRQRTDLNRWSSQTPELRWRSGRTVEPAGVREGRKLAAARNSASETSSRFPETPFAESARSDSSPAVGGNRRSSARRLLRTGRRIDGDDGRTSFGFPARTFRCRNGTLWCPNRTFSGESAAR